MALKGLVTLITIGVVMGTIPKQTAFKTEIEMPIILKVAKEYKLTPEDTTLLFAIRKAENGPKGYEFGVKAAKGTDLETQAKWAAGSIKANRERYYALLQSGPVSQGDTLSPHFKKSEFNQRQKPLELSEYTVHPELVSRLEKLREAIGGKPIKVTSGYRSPDYNKRVGGAVKSQHLSGMAADIMVEGMSAKQIAEVAKGIFPYIQTYGDKPHLHVDVRGVAPVKAAPKDFVEYMGSMGGPQGKGYSTDKEWGNKVRKIQQEYLQMLKNKGIGGVQ